MGCNAMPHGSTSVTKDEAYDSVDESEGHGESEGYDESEVEHPVDFDKDEYEKDDLTEESLQRGAVFGHSSIAANPSTYQYREGYEPPYQPDATYQPPGHPSPYGNKHKYQDTDDLDEALKQLDYVKWLITEHASQMKKSSHGSKCPPQPYPSQGDGKTCQPRLWKKCNCISPAKYSDEGRGNCNLGAAKPDIKVWCYVDPRNGDPADVCPDSKPSKTKYGFYWSRFACIT